MKITTGVFVLLAMLLPEIQAFPGASRAAREFAEWVTKSGGRKAARELAEYGGERAVRETLERVARESGEEVAQGMIRLGKQHGVMTFRALANNPKPLVEAMDALPPRLVGPAARALERNADEIATLVVRHGSNALEMAAIHPGVGPRLLQRFGDDLIPVGRELTEKQFMDFARYADDFARMPDSVRKTNLGVLTKSPQRVLDFLESHPTVFRTSVGAGLILILKDDVVDVVIGEAEVGPDGKHMPREGLISQGSDVFIQLISEIARHWILIFGVVFLIITPKIIISCRKKQE